MARLYHSSISGHGFAVAKAERSDSHNLRASCNLDLKDNTIPLLTKNNLLFVFGQQVSASDGDAHFKAVTARLKKEKSDYEKRLASNYSNDEKAELSHKRVETKKGINRFIKSSVGAEQVYWSSLYGKVGKSEIDPKNEIKTLQSLGKIKRFNDKVKRINQLGYYNGLIGDRSRNTSYTIFSKELLYKIPDDSKVNISPEHWQAMAKKIDSLIYPNFKTMYSVVHVDENPDNPHLHMRKSGLNIETGEFDIQDQVMANLAKQVKGYPFEGKKWADLSIDEVKKHGEIYQSFVFGAMNQFLNKLGYDTELVKKSAQEKARDFDLFKDSKRPISEREHNRQRKLKNENDLTEKSVSDLAIKKSILSTQNSSLERVNKRLNNENSLLEKTVRFMKEEAKSYLNRFMKMVKAYNQNESKELLFTIGETIGETHKTSPKLSQAFEDTAVDHQDTNRKKDAIRQQSIKVRPRI